MIRLPVAAILAVSLVFLLACEREATPIEPLGLDEPRVAFGLGPADISVLRPATSKRPYSGWTEGRVSSYVQEAAYEFRPKSPAWLEHRTGRLVAMHLTLDSAAATSAEYLRILERRWGRPVTTRCERIPGDHLRREIAVLHWRARAGQQLIGRLVVWRSPGPNLHGTGPLTLTILAGTNVRPDFGDVDVLQRCAARAWVDSLVRGLGSP